MEICASLSFPFLHAPSCPHAVHGLRIKGESILILPSPLSSPASPASLRQRRRRTFFGAFLLRRAGAPCDGMRPFFFLPALAGAGSNLFFRLFGSCCGRGEPEDQIPSRPRESRCFVSPGGRDLLLLSFKYRYEMVPCAVRCCLG